MSLSLSRTGGSAAVAVGGGGQFPGFSAAAPVAGSYVTPLGLFPQSGTQFGGAVFSQDLIKKQQETATTALTTQATKTSEMAEKQYETQLAALVQQKDAQIEMATNQFMQQEQQGKMQIEQQYQQALMMRQQERNQKEMDINQQAMAMTATANQQKLQREMAEAMTKLHADTAKLAAAAATK